jgi:malate dehydrogenase (oxaloacetate-decarboxylating)(NADP+)
MNGQHRPIGPHGEFSLPKGVALLTNSLLNKGTAYSERERDALGLRGLLPPRIFSIEKQTERAMINLRKKSSDLERYIFLTTLQHRNETLFYRVLLENLEETMPIIYTPTVGQACLEYGSIFRRPRGLYITIKDRGRIREVLRHWPHTGVRMIVVTDGERILGLGDLGAFGMGIPIGKLALYTACAGLHPYYCLPIVLDVGTNNQTLLQDPFYIGLNQERVRGAEYHDFVTEFVESVQDVFPGCLIQFEDFGNANAFHLLEQWSNKVCTFNDDIQGTAAVAVAGILAAMKATGGKSSEQKILFMGAGEAGLGIANLFTSHLLQQGLNESDARKQCWFMDSKGLIVASRLADLVPHKRNYAHEAPFVPNLLDAINTLKPTVLVGVSGQGKVFTREVVEAMASHQAHPVIFALSNPTSKAECTSQEALEWSGGRAIYASGSPMPAVEIAGRRIVPGQGNNVYIFPGLGLGALAFQSRLVTDAMFLTAAETLASLVTQEELAEGRVYPRLDRIREVSVAIAAAVARESFRTGLACEPEPDNIEDALRSRMFNASYQSYV